LEAALERNNARPTVAIIGAGIGGGYLAAMLGLIGCKARLHDIDDSRLKDLREAKGIQSGAEVRRQLASRLRSSRG
jgi:2-polyprenyl-6-methoxyphenol hydroxylase-like FAD-dependent oxidoreductase